MARAQELFSCYTLSPEFDNIFYNCQACLLKFQLTYADISFCVTTSPNQGEKKKNTHRNLVGGFWYTDDLAA
jgi:hypothetical protein